MAINIGVILKDEIQGYGVKSIFQDFFGITPVMLQSSGKFDFESIDLFITDPEIYVTNSDYFIPRRNRTIIIAQEWNLAENNMVVNRNSQINEFISYLSKIIKKIEKKQISTQSELSQREIDVLKLIASGLMNKEIADKLNISVNTVLTHRKNITSKLGIRSVSGLSFYAMMNGYVSNI